jgi:hypothetical protein
VLYKHLLKYLAENQLELNKRIVHVAKMIELIFRLINSGLVIEEHMMFMLEEEEEQGEGYEEEGEEGMVEQQNGLNIKLNQERSSLNVFFNMLKIVDFILNLKNA